MLALEEGDGGRLQLVTVCRTMVMMMRTVLEAEGRRWMMTCRRTSKKGEVGAAAKGSEK